jgi:hypothetical protein
MEETKCQLTFFNARSVKIQLQKIQTHRLLVVQVGVIINGLVSVKLAIQHTYAKNVILKLKLNQTHLRLDVLPVDIINGLSFRN